MQKHFDCILVFLSQSPFLFNHIINCVEEVLRVILRLEIKTFDEDEPMTCFFDCFTSFFGMKRSTNQSFWSISAYEETRRNSVLEIENSTPIL